MSSDDEFDALFKALAAPSRRRILDLLKEAPLTTGGICAELPALDRCTVMQHLTVLEEAGLVIVRRDGRQRWNHLNALPIKLIHDRWIAPHAARAVDVLARLKEDVERS